MANFLSISPNQTMFLPSVCLVPARLFCHSCCNLCSLFRSISTYILVDFKVAKWAVSSPAHSSNPFQVNIFKRGSNNNDFLLQVDSLRSLSSSPAQSTYFTVRGQSYFSRLPKYWPTIPLSARRVCSVYPPAFVAGGGLVWKTREIGLPSYSKICTLCSPVSYWAVYSTCSQYFSHPHLCDQLLWINDYICTHVSLLWESPNTHPIYLFQYSLFKYCIILLHCRLLKYFWQLFLNQTRLSDYTFWMLSAETPCWEIERK